MYKLIFHIERFLRIRLPLSQRRRWSLAISSEISFWDNYYRTKGSDWGDKYELKFNKNLELQSQIAAFFPKKNAAFDGQIKVLDVGAGPMTYLGKVFEGAKLDITAIDPLADAYNEVLAKYKIEPVIRTLRGDGEELDRIFDKESFDIVFAKNSIDHSYDPVKTITNMIRLSRERVILMHRVNEADNENWYGLHQWNFSCINGDFVISGKNSATNFTKEFSCLGDVKCFINEDDEFLYTIISKRK